MRQENNAGNFITGRERQGVMLDTSKIRIILNKITGERPDEIFFHSPYAGWLYKVTLFSVADR